MTTKIGIKGSGRIGRDYLRFVPYAPDLGVVAINDVTDSATRGDDSLRPMPKGKHRRAAMITVRVR